MSDSVTTPLTEILDQCEEAIYWHLAWYSRGMGHLMFGTEAGEDLIGKEAHTHCRTGRFLARFSALPGCGELIEEIEMLHEQMHALMRDALLERREGNPLREEALAEIIEMQSLFFGGLQGLFRKVMEDHCLMIAGHKLGASPSQGPTLSI